MRPTKTRNLNRLGIEEIRQPGATRKSYSILVTALVTITFAGG
jgi:hypothetical protein